MLDALCGILSGTTRSPNAILRVMLDETNSEDTKNNRERMRQKLRAMRRHGYISEYANTYTLSDKGRHIMEKEKLWSLSIPTPKRHDGLWRILVFDIPKEKSGVRIVFVRLLQNLGLRFYQRSVWIYPFPFENEVKKIGKVYGILQHVSFITAAQIDRVATLRKEFRILD